MSLKEDNRRDVVLYRIERAFTALAQAKLNQEINCLEVTVNRLYYAAYYAVSALLVAHQIPAHTLSKLYKVTKLRPPLFFEDVPHSVRR